MCVHAVHVTCGIIPSITADELDKVELLNEAIDNDIVAEASNIVDETIKVNEPEVNKRPAQLKEAAEANERKNTKNARS